jgi:molecular chaperone DnaK
MGLFVGIDLGTTNSVVSYKDGVFKFVSDEAGHNLIPSVVCFADGGYVGRDAVEKEEEYPDNTIRSSKRFIGQNIELIDGVNPTLVAEYILKYLGEITEKNTGQKIEGIVITVPAYFNQNQRIETKKAAESAGLNVLRIINEPTAAALAYGEDAKLNELVLVYDLGGGTFDVTLLQLSEDSVYQVLSTSGDTQLGGDDFDNLIIESFRKNLPDKFKPFKDFDVRLKKFAEQVKVQLGYKDTVKKQMKYCGTLDSKIYHHIFEITSSEYSEMIKMLLTKTKSHVLNALNDAGKKISQLDKIILVGGSTKSRYVREYVKDNFNTKVHHQIDPDLTVSAGAANLAHSLQEKSATSSVLIDVTPLSLGIETKGGLLHKIIPRNASIPVSSSEDFITSEDNQDCVLIKIYQGERPIAKDNEFLGEFELSGFEKRPKGQTKIVVKFDIDSSGLVNVSAFDKISGLQSNVTLKSLTSDKINESLDSIDTNINEDKLVADRIELEMLREQARTKAFYKSISDGQGDEYQEIYDSVKDSIDKLKIFIQSLDA